MHASGYGYEHLKTEGLDSTLLRLMYTELGLPTTTQGHTNSPSLAETCHENKILRAGAGHNAVTAWVGNDDTTALQQMPKAIETAAEPKALTIDASTPAPATVSIERAPNAEKRQDQRPPANSQVSINRSEYLARLRAAKSQNSSATRSVEPAAQPQNDPKSVVITEAETTVSTKKSANEAAKAVEGLELDGVSTRKAELARLRAEALNSTRGLVAARNPNNLTADDIPNKSRNAFNVFDSHVQPPVEPQQPGVALNPPCTINSQRDIEVPSRSGSVRHPQSPRSNSGKTNSFENRAINGIDETAPPDPASLLQGLPKRPNVVSSGGSVLPSDTIQRSIDDLIASSTPRQPVNSSAKSMEKDEPCIIEASDDEGEISTERRPSVENNDGTSKSENNGVPKLRQQGFQRASGGLQVHELQLMEMKKKLQLLEQKKKKAKAQKVESSTPNVTHIATSEQPGVSNGPMRVLEVTASSANPPHRSSPLPVGFNDRSAAAESRTDERSVQYANTSLQVEKLKTQMRHLEHTIAEEQHDRQSLVSEPCLDLAEDGGFNKTSKDTQNRSKSAKGKETSGNSRESSPN